MTDDSTTTASNVAWTGPGQSPWINLDPGQVPAGHAQWQPEPPEEPKKPDDYPAAVLRHRSVLFCAFCAAVALPVTAAIIVTGSGWWMLALLILTLFAAPKPTAKGE